MSVRRRRPYWVVRERAVESLAVRTRTASRCATCGVPFAPGAAARRDTWHEPVFGRALASLICAECDDAGL